MDNWNARTVLRRALIKAETLTFLGTPKYKIKGDVSWRDDESIFPRDFLGDFDTLDDLESAHSTAVMGDLAWVTDAGLYKYETDGWTYQASAPYPLTDIALELQKIQTPEFHFTQSTLREVLQGVGSFIHGEPRVDENNEITFDKYGSSDVFVAPTRYASKSIQQAVDSYATNLDSTVDNLVSSFGKLGAITEPYEGGFKTVRTEDATIRLMDDNMLIQTSYPIRSIRKLEVVYNSTESQDITGFVYESNDYGRLSSYDAIYPYTKAYALYYTIGSKNVYGLSFKNEVRQNAFQAFARLAIVNILNVSYGTDISSLESNYYKLSFRITYEPIYSARVQQNKSTLENLGEPSTIVYNQGQNLIESEYYGENLKGVIARMGNEDKVFTYVFNGLAEVPEMGKLWRENGSSDFYTSAVAVEVQALNTKYSVALSKHFNRYSDYVGVNSTKRLFEVSEQQAYDSHISYKDYVVIGSDVNIIPFNDFNDGLVSLEAIKEIFDNVDSENVAPPITAVRALGYTRESNPIKAVQLPVQTVSMGNSAVFVFKYKDNYSAGDSIINTESGLFSNYVPYGDYWGNVEFLQLNYLRTFPDVDTFNDIVNIGMDLPSDTGLDPEQPATINAEIDNRLWVSKGSTEIPTIDYQIDFIGYEYDWIIGSALAKNLPLICGTKTSAKKFCLFPSKLAQFQKSVDITTAVFSADITAKIESNAIRFNPIVVEGISADSTVMSWAVVDEDGGILFGKNEFIWNETTAMGSVYLVIKHDIFNKGE